MEFVYVSMIEKTVETNDGRTFRVCSDVDCAVGF